MASADVCVEVAGVVERGLALLGADVCATRRELRATIVRRIRNWILIFVLPILRASLRASGSSRRRKPRRFSLENPARRNANRPRLPRPLTAELNHNRYWA